MEKIQHCVQGQATSPTTGLVSGGQFLAHLPNSFCTSIKNLKIIFNPKSTSNVPLPNLSDLGQVIQTSMSRNIITLAVVLLLLSFCLETFAVSKQNYNLVLYEFLHLQLIKKPYDIAHFKLQIIFYGDHCAPQLLQQTRRNCAKSH